MKIKIEKILLFLLAFVLVSCSDEYKPEIGYDYDEVEKIITETSRIDTLYISNTDTIVKIESRLDTVYECSSDTIFNTTQDTLYINNDESVAKVDTVLIKDTLLIKDTIYNSKIDTIVVKESSVDTIVISNNDTISYVAPVIQKPVIKDTVVYDTVDGSTINVYPVYWIVGEDADTLINKNPKAFTASDESTWSCDRRFSMFYYSDPYDLFSNLAVVSSGNYSRNSDCSSYKSESGCSYMSCLSVPTTKGMVAYISTQTCSGTETSIWNLGRGILMSDYSLVNVGGLCATIREK